MTTLEDYIKLADGATEGPWSIKKSEYGDFIAASRTLGPAMAKALIEAEEKIILALNGVCDVSASEWDGGSDSIPNQSQTIEALKQSLATIERLRKGGV
jgi:hypothetical protein